MYIFGYARSWLQHSGSFFFFFYFLVEACEILAEACGI